MSADLSRKPAPHYIISKVDELDVFNEGVEVNAFTETTRWFGLKIRLEGTNLLDYIETRNRIIFTGSRALFPVSTRIFRERHTGRRIALSFSGKF